MDDPLLEAKDLTIQYETDSGSVTAVSNASFSIRPSEYFGLVGESGCGKSTIAKAVVGGLDDNGQITSGKLLYKGEEIQHLADKELSKRIRWQEISLIPQGSMNSLDPLMRIKEQAIEIAHVHGDRDEDEVVARLKDLFETVGLQTDRIDDYPHQFSGGMEQRAIIALALLLNPSLIIADEPTTALDVVMQDQIFRHLLEIRDEVNTSMLLITHDISLVFESCERMAVMHSGQIAERGPVKGVFSAPHHPYAIQLQRSFPDIRFPDRELESIEGAPPQNFGDVDYCTFVDRCPWAVEECREHAPELDPVDSGYDDHHAACFMKEEIAADDSVEAGGPSETEVADDD